MNRDPHVALKNALIAYLGPLEFTASRTWDWASITFDGMRHELAFTLPWSQAAADALDALPDVDLPMTGAF